MFQSQVICLDGELDDVINIRLELAQHTPSKSIRKITRKVEKNFSVKVQKLSVICNRKEALYSQHQKRFKGYQFKSLKQMLIGDGPTNMYDTYEVNVYDGDKLIAYSLFDIGKEGLASILGVFDDKYNSYSLGIYTMAAEVNWAKENNFKYYYPGYVVKDNPLFDYKLRLGDYKYFNWKTYQWEEFADIKILQTARETIETKLQGLADMLSQIGIKHEYKIYPYYSLGYLSMNNYQFYVKSPAHLYLPAYSTHTRKVILEYDAEEGKYVLAAIKVNQPYSDLLIHNNHSECTSPDHVWQVVLEYMSIHKYTHLERLGHNLWLNLP